MNFSEQIENKEISIGDIILYILKFFWVPCLFVVAVGYSLLFGLLIGILGILIPLLIAFIMWR